MKALQRSLIRRSIIPRLTVLLALLVIGCGSNAPAPPTVGATAPDLTLRTLAGDTAQLRDLRGRVVIVNFWATWCAPCEQETPRLVSWYGQYHAAGLDVLGVDTLAQDSREAVGEFVARYGVPYPVPLDASGDMARQWQALYLPRSYVIDRDGVVRYIQLGELTDQHFNDHVLPLLQAGG